jgi:hypothetical protein
MSLKDWMSGAKDRRLRRDVEQLEAAMPAGGAVVSERAAQDYGRALRAALQQDPALAKHLFDTYDHRIGNDRYGLAFRPGDGDWLTELVTRGDRNVLSVVFELATRLDLPGLQRMARDRLVDQLGRERDAAAAVA